MEKLKIGNMNVSFLSATRYHINGGILLMVIVLLAMIIANSPGETLMQLFGIKKYIFR